jgi:hypothetical protein
LSPEYKQAAFPVNRRKVAKKRAACAYRDMERRTGFPTISSAHDAALMFLHYCIENTQVGIKTTRMAVSLMNRKTDKIDWIVYWNINHKNFHVPL